jgi:hypothetical protein
MPKPRRTVLSGIVVPLVADSPAAGEPVQPTAARRRSDTIQQTVYLPPAVHDQLRELAFTERVKMHALIMEGLDTVFRSRGLKSLADLSGKS